MGLQHLLPVRHEARVDLDVIDAGAARADSVAPGAGAVDCLDAAMPRSALPDLLPRWHTYPARGTAQGTVRALRPNRRGALLLLGPDRAQPRHKVGQVVLAVARRGMTGQPVRGLGQLMDGIARLPEGPRPAEYEVGVLGASQTKHGGVAPRPVQVVHELLPSSFLREVTPSSFRRSRGIGVEGAASPSLAVDPKSSSAASRFSRARNPSRRRPLPLFFFSVATPTAPPPCLQG